MGIKCFLIEPVYGGTYPGDPHGWQMIDGVWQSARENFTIVGWKRQDSSEWSKVNSDFPTGAMWRAVWQPKDWDWENEKEPHLLVRCPNGPDPKQTHDWDIDSRCRNCAAPNDKRHRCWVRHGAPPMITVDKAGGVTCAAGAGSIALPNWHGYLDKGELVVSR